MIVAHLSDLHLRHQRDAAGLEAQLDRIVARRPDHLVVTGDLLDRWNPALLDHTLDLIEARGLLKAECTTIIPGNHDLASSGGHPRQRSDLWRLLARFWDPPPLLAARSREFHRRISARAPGVALPGATTKQISKGLRLAAIDSVPAFWMPISLEGRAVTLRHAEGAIPRDQLAWLSQQRGATPLIVLIHHYPLPVGAFRWTVDRDQRQAGRSWGLGSWEMVVRMEIEPDDRTRFWEAIRQSGARAVLCGHVHRARLELHEEVAVGLNGQSGADWAGRTIAYYEIEDGRVGVEHESIPHAA